MRRLLSTFGVFVFLMSCDHMRMRMHSYEDYLQQSVGREDHDAIAKKMGGRSPSHHCPG
jgi:hypothetical protein